MACSNPWYREDIVDLNGEPIPIPCGRCFSCRLDMQNTAIDRMFCAWKSHDVSAFVTFTYDDNHLPMKPGFRNATLSKDDLHKFLDNIKHQIKRPFEYYSVGEYGGQFNRPHYHVLFFGLDYQLHGDFLLKVWKKGSIKVLPVQPGAFRYVAKYITKGFSPDYNDSNYYDFGMIPPFRKISRGLGLNVYLNHLEEIREHGYFDFCGKRITVNRYYFNKLCGYNPLLILRREQSIDDTRRRNSEYAKRLGLSDGQYVIRRNLNRERALQSSQLREDSNLLL